MSKEITLMVMFNLKPGVQESDYLTWAKEVDLPTVNGLQNVEAFEVFKGISMFGSEQASPWQYFETIKLSNLAGFQQELQTELMQQVISQFQGFTDDAQFIVTEALSA